MTKLKKTSIIRNRMESNLPTYCAFIDFAKCFDWVDRELMLFQLTEMNTGGNILHSRKTFIKEQHNVYVEMVYMDLGLK